MTVNVNKSPFCRNTVDNLFVKYVKPVRCSRAFSSTGDGLPPKNLLIALVIFCHLVRIFFGLLRGNCHAKSNPSKRLILTKFSALITNSLRLIGFSNNLIYFSSFSISYPPPILNKIFKFGYLILSPVIKP